MAFNFTDLICDGLWHTLDIDTSTAVFQTNESNIMGQPGVWLKAYLSGYASFYSSTNPTPRNYLKTLWDIERISGTLSPKVQTFSPQGAFDEFTPNFNDLQYHNAPGDGLLGANGWHSRGVAKLQHGRNGSLLAFGQIYGSDILYYWVGDYNETATGVIKLKYKIPPPPDVYIVNATDDVNLSNPYVTVLSDAVKTVEQTLVNNANDTGAGETEELRDVFYVRGANLPPPGEYHVEVKTRTRGTYQGSSNYGVVRNGVPVGFSQPISTTLTDPGSWSQITSFFEWPEDGYYGYPHGGGSAPYNAIITPPVIPINTGDTISFRWDGGIYFGSPYWSETLQVRFTRVGGAPRGNGALKPPEREDPIGSRPGVPGNIIVGTTTYTYSRIPGDLTVLPNGDVYVIHNEQVLHNSIILHKYTAATDSWSLISNNVWDHGYDVQYNTDYTFNGMAITNDGTNVYMVWGEPDGSDAHLFNGGGFHPSYNSWWRCKKWNGATLTELGSGQRFYAPAFPEPSTAGYAEQGIQAKCGPDGTLWVCWTEVGNQSQEARPSYWSSIGFLAKWTGSSWSMYQVPNPLIYNLTDYYFYWIAEVTQAANTRQIDMTFCHHDGPSNYPSVAYNAFLSTNGQGQGHYRTVYTEFNGSSFVNTIDVQVAGLYRYGDLISPFSSPSKPFDSWWQQGMALVDNGKVPYLMMALGAFFQGSGKIAVMRVKADGSDMEAYYEHEHPDDEWAWFTDTNDMVCVNGVFVTYFGDYNTQPVILVDSDMGTGQGWKPPSTKGYVLPYMDTGVTHRMDTDGKSAYVLLTTYDFGNKSQTTRGYEGAVNPTPSYLMGVWKIDIPVGGPISVHGLTPWR